MDARGARGVEVGAGNVQVNVFAEPRVMRGPVWVVPPLWGDEVARPEFKGIDVRVEFEQRLQAVQTAGERPDPRDAQITRLKNEVTALRQRLTESASTINELTEFRTQTLAQLAAQHDEITRLRASATAASRIRRLPQQAATIGSRS